MGTSICSTREQETNPYRTAAFELMSRLTAEYSIDIPSPCLIQWPIDETPTIDATIDGFSVRIVLQPVKDWRLTHKEENYYVTSIDSLEIFVSREENESPPPSRLNAKGGTDFSDQYPFINERATPYRDIAVKAANRLLNFYKYHLHAPLIEPIPEGHNGFANPRWFIDDDEQIAGNKVTFTVEYVAGLHGELRTYKFRPADESILQKYLTNVPDHSLADELLADAKSAWFEHNYRRAVLELAICVEVMVKRKYFEKASPAGAAFDYLEDKSQIRVRVLDLIDKIASEAFNRSFKNEHKNEYNHIDELFRCRNKIAHRGELKFRNEAGQTVEADSDMVALWWEAAYCLKDWLHELS
ncbi:MAG: hypothetical protein R2834_02860 [Rhodothermales bacterium]